MSTSPYILAVVEGPQQDKRFPVPGAGCTLGRSSQCEICIADPELSRSHCRFEVREGELWAIDLASANETLVNGTPIDERRLVPGDLIQVGRSTLRLERTPDAPSPLPTVPPAADEAPPEEGGVVIDLGFGQTDGSAQTHSRKHLLRPALWTFGAILVLVAGTTLIMDPARLKGKQPAVKTLDTGADKSLLVHYEKVEASVENIFRYELTLAPSGLLTVKIDDLAGQKRHVRKEKSLSPDLLAELAGEIENSGFFALDRSYSGFAAPDNSLNQWELTVAIGDKTHTCRVANRQEPEGFRRLREKLETFSKNELGIWAIQYSTDKLIELAKDALAVAHKKFDERDVRFGNLHEALASFQEAVFYLDTVNPKPDFYAEIIDGFENAEAELDKRYEEHRFQANRAINLKDWPQAARELKILREIIPAPSDGRHREATQKLLDVEARLKKGRH